MVKKLFLTGIFGLVVLCLQAQVSTKIAGRVYTDEGRPAALATVRLQEIPLQVSTDENGSFFFNNVTPGTYTLIISLIGYIEHKQSITVQHGDNRITAVSLVNNPVELEQVTVTAEKKENNLQYTPMAVSALNGRQIEERKITEMGDLVLSVPNLMTMNMGAPTLSAISIRGILTFSTDPAVGIYLDGVPMFDGYSSSLQMQDVERVEVLRGPQSTLYGRNALGGIINIITRQPGNTLKGFAEAGFSNYGGQRYSAGISGPIVKNRLFAGFSGLYDTRNGYFRNAYNNRKFDKPETFNGNFYLKYLAGENFSLTLNVKGEQNNITGAFPYVVNADSAFKDPYTLNVNGTNIEKRTVLSNSLTAAWKLKGAQLSSMTAYTLLDDTYRDYDADYTPYEILTYEMPYQKQKTWIQELRIVTDSYKKLKLTAGAFGFIDNKKPVSTYSYGPDAAAFDPNAPYTTNTYSDKTVKGFAAYANLTYSISTRLNVSAGLRYDYEDRKMSFSTDFVKEPDPPVVISPEQVIKGSNSALSPKLSISYLPAKDLQLYATYSRGYRPGGFNQYALNATQLNYDPEYTDNYELGFKSEWLNHRLRINAAAFYTYWKDQQQALSLPEPRVANVGKLVTSGAELEVTALVAKGLEIRYNLGIVHSDYRSLILTDASTGSDNKDYKGNRQIFTPSFTSAVSLSYHYRINEKTVLYAVPEWKYLGKQYMTYYNDLVQDPFSLLNASVGLRFSGYELSVWGKNLGDARYLSFAYATQTGSTTPVLLGIPRTYGITLKARL